jgi:ribokinase
MYSNPRICVVGSSNIDLTFRTPRLPRPGETLTGQAFHLGYGGKGANQAVMAARLGAKVTMVTKIGGDVFGDGTRRNYQAEGIDTSYVLTDTEQPSGVAGIVVNDSAQNCIILAPGANSRLTPEDVRRAAAAIEAAGAVLCQLEIPLESTLEAFRIARAAGVRTILNPAPAQQLPEELLRLTDICVPNETELEQLTGLVTSELKQVEMAAQQLRERGPRTVIVTLGERGALIVDGQGVERIAAVAVKPVDTTGAGDAFIGSLAVSLAEGRPQGDAVRIANAVAGFSVTRPGTQTSFPRREEAEALFTSLALHR